MLAGSAGLAPTWVIRCAAPASASRRAPSNKTAGSMRQSLMALSENRGLPPFAGPPVNAWVDALAQEPRAQVDAPLPLASTPPRLY